MVCVLTKRKKEKEKRNKVIVPKKKRKRKEKGQCLGTKCLILLMVMDVALIPAVVSSSSHFEREISKYYKFLGYEIENKNLIFKS